MFFVFHVTLPITVHTSKLRALTQLFATSTTCKKEKQKTEHGKLLRPHKRRERRSPPPARSGCFHSGATAHCSNLPPAAHYPLPTSPVLLWGFPPLPALLRGPMVDLDRELQIPPPLPPRRLARVMGDVDLVPETLPSQQRPSHRCHRRPLLPRGISSSVHPPPPLHRGRVQAGAADRLHQASSEGMAARGSH